MRYQFPFGQELHPVVQEDQTPKKVFVLGVYASAVHARWMLNGKPRCQALAVASEPCIFWKGDKAEAERIIKGCRLPKGAGKLEPAAEHLNGPSGRALDTHVLEPLGLSRDEAWLCDLLPEARINPRQWKVIQEKYHPLIERYGLGLQRVTVPCVDGKFCDNKRIEEITNEIRKSKAQILITLGDAPIVQYIRRVVPTLGFQRLSQYGNKIGYGKLVPIRIAGMDMNLLPLAHPRQVAKLGAHNEKWYEVHQKWMDNIRATKP